MKCSKDITYKSLRYAVPDGAQPVVAADPWFRPVQGDQNIDVVHLLDGSRVREREYVSLERRRGRTNTCCETLEVSISIGKLLVEGPCRLVCWNCRTGYLRDTNGS
jgi:hypothetical protein